MNPGEGAGTGAGGRPDGTGGPDGDWTRVCPSDALAEGGDGVRFDLAGPAGAEPAFVLRIDGRARAWLNRCAHVPVELDWTPGRFLDDTGTAIVCATHGAVYDARDGACLGGPCRGRGLRPVACRESDGWIEVLTTRERVDR